jgi:hypothetical protein
VYLQINSVFTDNINLPWILFSVLEAIGNQGCSESVMVCALSNEVTVNIGLSRVKKGIYFEISASAFVKTRSNRMKDFPYWLRSINETKTVCYQPNKEAITEF